ncbi:MAG TPA: hypothetical protein DHN33_03935 [Eubacteriaceae bacterium]|nr:hypothetical protein [Eubacteriaceae bacterium]
MAIKAKEINKRPPIRPKTMFMLFALLIVFRLILSYLQDTADPLTLQVISSVGIVISITLFVFLIRKILPHYELFVVDGMLLVTRRIFFRKKAVLSVDLLSVNEIKPRFEMPRSLPKAKDLSLFGIKDKVAYAIGYREEEKQRYAIIQSDKKFMDKLKREKERLEKRAAQE